MRKDNYMRFCAHLEGNYQIAIGATKFFRTWRVPVHYNLSFCEAHLLLITKSKSLNKWWKDMFLFQTIRKGNRAYRHLCMRILLKFSIKCIVICINFFHGHSEFNGNIAKYICARRSILIFYQLSSRLVHFLKLIYCSRYVVDIFCMLSVSSSWIYLSNMPSFLRKISSSFTSYRVHIFSIDVALIL
jgi:hypothetical protein